MRPLSRAILLNYGANRECWECGCPGYQPLPSGCAPWKRTNARFASGGLRATARLGY